LQVGDFIDQQLFLRARGHAGDSIVGINMSARARFLFHGMKTKTV
jgi:hypothetical protein